MIRIGDKEKTRIEVHRCGELLYAKTFYTDDVQEPYIRENLDGLIQHLDRGFPFEDEWGDDGASIRMRAIFPDVKEPEVVMALFERVNPWTFLTFDLDVIRQIEGIREDFISTGGGFDYLVLWKPLQRDTEMVEPKRFLVCVNNQMGQFREDKSTNCWIYTRDLRIEQVAQESYGHGWDPENIAFSLWKSINYVGLPNAEEYGIKPNKQLDLKGNPFWH